MRLQLRGRAKPALAIILSLVFGVAAVQAERYIADGEVIIISDDISKTMTDVEHGAGSPTDAGEVPNAGSPTDAGEVPDAGSPTKGKSKTKATKTKASKTKSAKSKAAKSKSAKSKSVKSKSAKSKSAKGKSA